MAACSISDADRLVFRLAWPSIISELSVPIVGIVGTVVVGHLKDASDLSGIALAVAIFNPVLFIFNFLRMGTGGLAAQAFGAEDGQELVAVVVRGVSLGLLIGVVLWTFQEPLLCAGFAWVPPPDPMTSERARDYFHARILGAPAALANYAVSAWLICVQRPRQALVTNLVLNVSNATLSVVFAWVYDFGVSGVGLATAVANYIALGLGLLQVCCVSRQIPWILNRGPDKAVTWKVVFDKGRLLKLIHLNGNIFLRSACLMFIMTDFSALAAMLGTVPLAANNLLMQLQMLISYGADGFANAAEAMVGEAVGMGDRRQVRTVVIAVMRWAVVLAFFFTALYVFCGKMILAAMTSHQDVVEYATMYLPWQWLAPFLSVTAYMMDGIFVGATRPIEMRNATFLAMVSFVLIGHGFEGSNNTLWIAFLVHLIVREMALMTWYPRIECSAELSVKQGLLSNGDRTSDVDC